MQLAITLLIIFLLNACGLKPVYSEKHPRMQVIRELESIIIEPSPSIQGAEFYHRLVSILPHLREAKYLLKIQFLDIRNIPTTMGKSSDVLRNTINQIIQYQLIETSTNKILVSDKFDQSISYNTILKPYAVSVERDKTEIDLAYQVAEELRNRLILYFTQKATH